MSPANCRRPELRKQDLTPRLGVGVQPIQTAAKAVFERATLTVTAIAPYGLTAKPRKAGGQVLREAKGRRRRQVNGETRRFVQNREKRSSEDSVLGN